jgi:hypothetical protein
MYFTQAITQVATCPCKPIQLRLNLSHEEVKKVLTEVLGQFKGGRRQVGIIHDEGSGTFVYAPDLRDDVHNALVDALSPSILNQGVDFFPRAYANVPWDTFCNSLQDDGEDWDGLPASLFEGLQVVPVTQIAWRGSTQTIEREPSFYVLGDLPAFPAQIAKVLLLRLERLRRMGREDLPRVTLWCRYHWGEEGTLLKQKAFFDMRA